MMKGLEKQESTGEFQAEEIEALVCRKSSDKDSAAGTQWAREKWCRKWLERPGLPGPGKIRWKTVDFTLSAGKAIWCVIISSKTDIQITGGYNDLFNISNLTVYLKKFYIQTENGQDSKSYQVSFSSSPGAEQW